MTPRAATASVRKVAACRDAIEDRAEHAYPTSHRDLSGFMPRQ